MMGGLVNGHARRGKSPVDSVELTINGHFLDFISEHESVSQIIVCSCLIAMGVCADAQASCLITNLCGECAVIDFHSGQVIKK